MIVFVSDLHLEDSVERATVDTARLLRHLTSIAEDAHRQKVNSLTIVLLGDIFDLLRSKLWFRDKVRPWERCESKHVDTVTEIVERVIAANGTFFQGLRTLVSKFGKDFVKLLYIPGNHDRPINTEMGARGRDLLLRQLPLPTVSNGLFPEQLLEEEHELLALHGHEWDSLNRYSPELAAIGDAIVIEIIMRLPLLVSEKLGISDTHPDLDFLYELDNVHPHSPGVISQWLDSRLPHVRKTHPDIESAIQKSLEDIISEIERLKGEVEFESFVVAERRLGMLIRAVRWVTTKLKYKRTLRLFPEIEEANPYPEFALHELKYARETEGNHRYVICGHTHYPVIVPLDPGEPAPHPARMYINTGTWRRVRRPVNNGGRPNGQPPLFSSWDEQCVVSIFNREDQRLGYPPYEFYRLTCGSQK